MKQEQPTRKFEFLRERLEELQARAGKENTLPDIGEEIFAEVASALEELEVADEELRLQNEALEAAREEADEHRRRYENLFEFAPDGYLVTDDRGLIREANRAAALILNVTQSFLLNKPLAVFLPHIHELMREERTENREVMARPRGKEPFPASVSSSRMRDAEGKLDGFRFRLSDISLRKQAEEKRRESEDRYRRLSEGLEDMVDRKVAELRQAESMAALGQMISAVAHELKNPLQNIRFATEVIQKKVGEDKDAREAMKDISGAITSLNALVGQLLDYSRPVKLECAPWPVRDMVVQALYNLRRKLKKIDVHLDLDREDTEVYVDAEKMTRALVNLISNAAEAMPEGGALKIRSRFSEVNGMRALALTVSDTGPGIEPDALEMINEPFFTTKPRGTGLGISIARKIIESHRGSLTLTSAPGQGTTAEITIPVELP